jgi:hypothetical protein
LANHLDNKLEEISMKKLIIAAAAAAMVSGASFASAAAFDGTFTPSTDSATAFVLTGFTLPLSAGVTTTYSEDSTAIGVMSVHSKGTQLGWGGSSNGGGIVACGAGGLKTTGCSDSTT